MISNVLGENFPVIAALLLPLREIVVGCCESLMLMEMHFDVVTQKASAKFACVRF